MQIKYSQNNVFSKILFEMFCSDLAEVVLTYVQKLDAAVESKSLQKMLQNCVPYHIAFHLQSFELAKPFIFYHFIT